MVHANQAGQRVGILVVDDQPEQLRTLALVLQDPAYDVVTARSGEDALRELLERDFAVILLDVRMPGMDGFEMARLLRSRRRTRETPILFLTGLDVTSSSIAEASQVGAADYLAKPVDADLLRTKVRAFVQLHYAQERLENEVSRRTEELLRTNETLRREIEDRRQAQRTMEFLAEASKVLSSSLDYETTLARIAELGVSRLADWCLVDFLEEDGSVRRVAAAHGDARLEDLAQRLRENPPDPAKPVGIARVLRSGESEIYPEVPDQLWPTIARTPEHLQALKETGIRSVIIVALKARNRILGAITLWSCRPDRRYSAADLAVAEDLAHRAALAVDNAILYRDAHREIARRQEIEERLQARAARSVRHRQVLVELANTLADDLDSIFRQMTEKVARTLEVDRVSVWEYTPDRAEIVCRDLFSLSKGAHQRGLRLRAADYPSYFAALEKSRVVPADDACADPRTSEFAEGYLRPLRITSMMDVPVRLEGRLVAIVCHEHTGPIRKWSDEEQDFASSVSDLVSLAMEGAERRRVEEAQRFLADTGRLLSSTLSATDRIDAVARLFVPRLADYCVIEAIDGDGRVARAGACHADAELDRKARQFLNRPSSVAIGSEPGEGHLLFSRLTPEGLEEIGRETEHVEFLKTMGARSALVVPMRARGNRVGSIALFHGPSGRTFQPSDVDFIQALVDRAALAVDNARLYEAVLDFNRILELRVEERTNALTQALKDLDAFAYTVAHDLRAPLRSMAAFSQLLLAESAEKLGGQEKDFLQRIADSAHHMDAMVQDLLAYSRLARETVTLETVSLEGLVNEILKQMALELQERNAQVTVDRPLPRVRGHRTSLYQAVMNLLQNAAKYVAPGVSPEIRVRSEKRKGKVRLWVEDHGIGISREYHEKIFGLFERLHPRERYAGTGIGLSIVRKAVEKMGGSVGVESEEGKGSRFWIELPGVHGSESRKA